MRVSEAARSRMSSMSAGKFGSCGKSSSLVLATTNLDNSSKRDVVQESSIHPKDTYTLDYKGVFWI